MNTQDEINLGNIATLMIANRDAKYPFIPKGYSIRNIEIDGDDTYVGFSAASTPDDVEGWVTL